ncbi:S9 family peptidase [Shewanella litorisediminis]|uniref:S9 family peptidase n=1 Tax=Shewanella litorisediminis TaxID=1173586 RepID=A0ABX7G3X2_9GAMM|nr:S9 family peptidase [Shewanella litorisediminis]MCL2919394.1 S9 family peptidase [Shewanella litorisediminis]QRH01990.1 S9 family peptidase [Shewanella litorisediminis]
MKRQALVAGVCLMVSACSHNIDKHSGALAREDAVPLAPVAAKVPYEMTHHGVTRVDDYYWLRDDDRADADVIAHLNAENAYAEARMTPWKGLKDKLFAEMTARMVKDDSSVPYLWNGQYYYRRVEGDREYPIIARKASLDGAEEVLLDANERAAGQEFYSLGNVSVSADGKLLAFGEDLLSRRIYKLYFKDLASGALLDDVLENTEGEAVWANDGKHVFYIAKDPQTLLGYQVYRHRLGTPQSEDVLVYEEADDSFYIGLGKTLDGSRILLFHESTTTTEVQLLDADQPLGNFTPFLPREEGHEYAIAKLDDDYYVLTNWQATNFRLMKVSGKDTADKSRWQEVVPYNEQVRIEDMLLLKDALVLQTREAGATHIRVYGPDGSQGREIHFDEAAYVTWLGTNRDQSANTVRFGYSSLTTPDATYEYNIHTGERKLLKQLQVPGFEAGAYQSERLMLPARDGALVPVSVVYRKDRFKKDGTNPLYQYGYGAYGSVVDPDFSLSALSLLDRGVVYAIAHVRGGEMLGRPWYDAGRMFDKKNSFTDFIDVTDALVNAGYGAKGKVVASGASAGGLLVGAVANMAPDRYLAIHAGVPFVDVVTTMLDESIPLTTNEYDEWGNPNEKPSFDYMLSYSPYDNVARQPYPHLLVTTGLHDSQVQYFEPAKWVAKLRELKTDNNELLLVTDMEAGHGGKSGRYRQFEDTALEFAFFLHLWGLE